ncbi:CmpA/NrtA family ABC transporter substrate-binding protein [Falsiruegeria mediterranea]|jgi:two-component system, oxyanion-binding sensor|uniref:Nitrate transport protein NrtA n=1 Tax=Falsiruegeria mediterranea M17 TaxID=1200281 RepID=A0A2R8CET0_9RHOB|nr:CmpA/NrtA family ABC transporter substrate-binding protein [Falsiruegeria mediterranea]SPJ30944.1 Nitrate transport protein NrtA [Falsiruegeria mediterranea M17]
MTRSVLHCGFVPLVDAAPLVIARELGFAAKEGIILELLKQPSWSALRDMLAMRHLEAAHMLSPMPIAMSLGLGGVKADIHAVMVLSVNGNVLAASNTLIAHMRAIGWNRDLEDAYAVADALEQAAQGPIRFGVPFPFSMHRELVEYWLRGRDLQIEIHSVPPPMMSEALKSGEVDAFCVGEPWGSRAVDAEAGELILAGRSIWAFSPEKVLAARRDWIKDNPDQIAALMRAVYHAGCWLQDPGNRVIATDILARQEYLGLPADVIERAMKGHLLAQARSFGTEVPGFLHFNIGAANFPWRSQAQWIGSNLAHRHGLELGQAIAHARQVFRSDLYREVMGAIGIDLPGASDKQEGALTHPTAVASTRGGLILQPDYFFDGAIFDPDRD